MAYGSCGLMAGVKYVLILVWIEAKTIIRSVIIIIILPIVIRPRLVFQTKVFGFNIIMTQQIQMAVIISLVGF